MWSDRVRRIEGVAQVGSARQLMALWAFAAILIFGSSCG